MVRIFNSRKDTDLLANKPFAYEFCLPWLDFAGFVVSRGESVELAGKEPANPNELFYYHLPRDKKLWENADIVWLTAADLIELEKEVNVVSKKTYVFEYLYRTQDFINMKGPAMANFRRRVNQFKKTYQYKIYDSYDPDKIKEFNNHWAETQKEKNLHFEDSFDFYRFCLKNHKKYGIKILYVEVDSKLVGLTMGIEHGPNRWAGLHLKADYKYKGLGRFLFHERAKLFQEREIFTTGSSAEDKGIEKYKEELNPIDKVEYFQVKTGSKKAQII